MCSSPKIPNPPPPTPPPQQAKAPDQAITRRKGQGGAPRGMPAAGSDSTLMTGPMGATGGNKATNMLLGE